MQSGYVRMTELGPSTTHQHKILDRFVVLGDMLDKFNLFLSFRKSLLYVAIFIIFATFWPSRDPQGVSTSRTVSLTLLTSSVSMSVPLTGGGSRDLDSWSDVASPAEALVYFRGLGGLLFQEVTVAADIVASTDQPIQAFWGTYLHGVMLRIMFDANNVESVKPNLEAYLNSFMPPLSNEAEMSGVAQIAWECDLLDNIVINCRVPIYSYPFNASYAEDSYFKAVTAVQQSLISFDNVGLTQNYTKIYVIFSNNRDKNFFMTVTGGWVNSLSMVAVESPSSLCYKVSLVAFDSSIEGYSSLCLGVLSFIAFLILLRMMIVDYGNYVCSLNLMTRLETKFNLGLLKEIPKMIKPNSLKGWIQFIFFGWRIVDFFMLLTMAVIFVCRLVWFGFLGLESPDPDTLVSKIFDIEKSRLAFPSYMRYIQSVTVLLIGFRCLLSFSDHPAIRVYFLAFERLIPRLSVFLVVLFFLILITAIALTDVFRQTGGNSLFQSIGESFNSVGLLTFGNLDFFGFYNEGKGFGSATEVLTLAFWLVAFYSLIFAQNMMLALVSEAYEEAKMLFDDCLYLKEKDVNHEAISGLQDSGGLERVSVKSKINDFTIRKHFNDLSGYETNPYYGQRTSHPLEDFFNLALIEIVQLVIRFLKLCSCMFGKGLAKGAERWLVEAYPREVSISKHWNAMRCLYAGFYSPYTESLDHRAILNHSGSGLWAICNIDCVEQSLDDKITLASVNLLNLPLLLPEFSVFVEQCYTLIHGEYAEQYPSFFNEVMLNLPFVGSICRAHSWALMDGEKTNAKFCDDMFDAFKRQDCQLLKKWSTRKIGLGSVEEGKKKHRHK